MNTQQCTGRTLAFLGDAVWSVLVREYFIQKGYGRGDDLQKWTVCFVNAKAQAHFYEQLHQENFFTLQEEEIFKRGRNANTGCVPQHTPVILYRKSTGFEAIIGALYLERNTERIQEIWDKVKTIQEV